MLEQALRANHGIQTDAARAIEAATGRSYSRTSMNRAVLKSERLQRAIKEAEEETLDLAESGLTHHLRNHDITAIKFFLETRGKHRGYSRKVYQLIAIDPRKMTDDELMRAVNDMQAVTLDKTEYSVDGTPAAERPPKHGDGRVGHGAGRVPKRLK